MDTRRARLPGLPNTLKARRLGIDTHHEAVVFVRADSAVSRSEGFASRARVEVRHLDRRVVATLYHVTSEILAEGEAGLSDSAWRGLRLVDGAPVSLHHPVPAQSLAAVRGKAFGRNIDEDSARSIITDIVAGQYSDVHIASFVTACTARPLDFNEVVALTGAMIEAGGRLRWNLPIVIDKHCIGGLPGNRTTPIVVAIVVANGLCMPKTSSRAITSPAGTADTMEVLAPVNLDIATMRRVVEQEGGCIVWGGAVGLSPADDLLIRVERALDLDGEGQMVASILSKKIAAGATRVVVDIPVGATAKVRNDAAAHSLSSMLTEVANAFGIRCHSLIGDGTQPIGRGIGPALEARDVLQVLRCEAAAPEDLRQRALFIAGELLEVAGAAPSGSGVVLAQRTLDSGAAARKFDAICRAQGGMRPLPIAAHSHVVAATRAGAVRRFDNRKLALIAKLAGAPDAKAAGVDLHVHLGDSIAPGQPLYTIHAHTTGELTYASEFAARNGEVIAVDD